MASPAPSQAGTQPTIHEAELGSGPTGVVDYYDPPITEQQAIQRRRLGLDVVVRNGAREWANRQVAQRIESAVGPTIPHPAHTGRGRYLALPHFQQLSPPPGGHSFWETSKTKARRKR
jgi:hypothetical protein